MVPSTRVNAANTWMRSGRFDCKTGGADGRIHRHSRLRRRRNRFSRNKLASGRRKIGGLSGVGEVGDDIRIAAK